MNKIRLFLLLVLAAGLGWLGWGSLSNAGNDALKLTWTAKTGKPINLAPVVIGQRVLVIPHDGPLLAFDKTSGAKKWTYDPPEQIWHRSLGTDGERAFVCHRNGDIVGLSAVDGEFLWKQSLGINCQRPPHISGGVLYVATTFVGAGLPGDILTGAKLFALNPKDGAIIWQFKSENYLLQTPYRHGDTVYVAGSYIDPKIVVDEGGPARFYALDSATGKPKWKTQTEDGFTKALYATDDVLVFVGYQDFLSGLDTKTGHLIWRRDTGNWVPSLAGRGDTVYYGSANTKVHAWNVNDGKSVWQFNIPGESFNYLLIKPVFTDKRTYFMSQRGDVFALNLKTGKELWSYATNMTVRNGVALGDNTLYMGDVEGKVYAYKIMR